MAQLTIQTKVEQEKLSMIDSLSDGDKHRHLLIAGYIHEFEKDNKYIIIPKEILIIILLFCPKHYEVLKFDPEFKSKKVIISDDGKCATKDSFGNFWILAGGDAVKQGIAVWRIKVCYFLK